MCVPSGSATGGGALDEKLSGDVPSWPTAVEMRLLLSRLVRSLEALFSVEGLCAVELCRCASPDSAKDARQISNTKDLDKTS